MSPMDSPRVHCLASDVADPVPQLAEDIIAGLTSPDNEQPAAKQQLHHGLSWSKVLPMRVLYENEGIQFYERITHDPCYYLYENEISLLRKRVGDIVRHLFDNSDQQNASNTKLTLVDLGAGRVDKATVLLQEMMRHLRHARTSKEPTVDTTQYCAIDLQYEELSNRLECIESHLQKYAACLGTNGENAPTPAISGICGSYFAALRYQQHMRETFETQPNDSAIPDDVRCFQRHCFLWLGSSMTNMTPPECVQFLQHMRHEFIRPGDSLLIGVDICRDVEKISEAYGEGRESWQQYLFNGLKNAGRILGGHAAAVFGDGAIWEYVSKWDNQNGRHLRFVKSKVDVELRVPELIGKEGGIAPGGIQTVRIAENEHILVGQSYKYSMEELNDILDRSGLRRKETWYDDDKETALILLGLS